MDSGYTDDSFACVSLHRDELLPINNALNEVLHGPGSIPRSEFHTRSGVFPEEALVLLQQIGQLLDRFHRAESSSGTGSSYVDNWR